MKWRRDQDWPRGLADDQKRAGSDERTCLLRRGSDFPSRIFARYSWHGLCFPHTVMLAQAKRYVIVQRGRVALFAALQKRYATDPNRRVIWDRRRGEDRRIARLPITVERRRDQRRMPVDDDILITRGYFVAHAMRARRRRMPQA